VTGGLHGKAERCARGVTVYLVPGLTACQRRAVIRRLRQEASRGLSPELPQPQLAIALGLLLVQSAARTVGGMVRLHPAVTLVPGAFVVALMALFVVVSAGRPGIAPAPGPSRAEAAAAPASGRAPGGEPASQVLPYVVTTTDGGGKVIGPGRGPLLPVTAVAEADANSASGAGTVRRRPGRHAHAGARWRGASYACSHGRAVSRGRAVSHGPGWTAARSYGGRHGCRRWKTGGRPPCTDHFPGPRALAW